MGALNALIGTIMAIQVPPGRIGVAPYVLALTGLGLMFCGYYIAKRKDWN